MSAPVSTGVSLTSRSSQKINLRGTDRFGHIADLSKYGEGKVVFDVPLVPSGVPRLRNLAASYQRIRWKRIVVRFEPLVPTMTVGGYVCGFVPDAQDSLSDSANPLDRLLAHPGSKLAKSWMSSTVAHRCTPDLLYTSQPPKGEARLYSPGRVALIIDSSISAGTNVKAPMSIYLDWEVELSEPALEVEAPQVVTLTARSHFYARASNVGLWYKDSTGGDDPRSELPGIQFNVVYRLGSKRFYWVGADATEELGNFDKVKLVNDATHGITLAICDYNGKEILVPAVKNIFMIEKGDVLVPEQENRVVGLEYLQCRTSNEKSGPKPKQSCEQSEALGPWELV